MADCLSTSLFILGEEAAIEYHNNYDANLILVTEDDRVIVVGDIEFEESAEGYTYEYVK